MYFYIQPHIILNVNIKTLQHVSIIILIIFRELVGSFLKSLNLKLLKFKIIKADCGDAAQQAATRQKTIGSVTQCDFLMMGVKTPETC
jgi:hypothetical protein